MSEEINRPRRRFFGAAGVTIAAAQLGMIRPAGAQSGKVKSAALPAIKPGMNTSFTSMKQIDAGVLNVGYAEAGRQMAPRSFFCTAGPTTFTATSMSRPLLASAGYRVLVPYVRGCGTTRFLSNETLRNGQQAAVAIDVIAFMDALKIEKAILGGYDWGGRSADIVAAPLAGALQGLGRRERLSDRQPGSQQDAVAAKG